MNIIAGKEESYKHYKEINNDPYGSGVVQYGEAWASLMEQEIAGGQKLLDIANRTSHEADTDGITGFMYGCAVQALSKYWIHGEELRQWHNLKTQLQHEGEEANKSGGVLNPALLNIGQYPIWRSTAY